MKEGIKKLFAILVLFILIINSSFLLVISTAIDAITNLIDESKIKPVVEMKLEKYVNYKISDELKGMILQTVIKTGIEYEEGQEYVPIRATKVTANLTKVEGKYPDSVEIITNSTKATNGDDNGKDVYYGYDQQTGKLEIVVDNKENDKGEIYRQNVEGAKDEFVVIANYGADCYNGINAKRDLKISGTIEEILANEDKNKISANYEENFEVTEDVSGLISTEISTSEIYNGYIYSNAQNGTQKDTEYTENMKLNISYKNIAEELTFETDNKFRNSKNKEVETQEIVYKSAKLNKQNILDILGEDGKLQILDKDGTILGEINKDTEAQEDGSIEINYGSEQTDIIVKITEPIKLGTINIENKKLIKSTMTDVNNNKILISNIIKCVNNVEEKDEETQEVIKEYTEDVYSFENSKEIEIKQGETRVDLTVDKSEWTNNVQNEVTFTATLVTSGSQYNLFKNPVIDIKLPQEVEKVILGDISLLYNNNLSVKAANVVEENSGKIIRVQLSGCQDEYALNSIVNGVNVIVHATVILKKDIDSNESSINITYTNGTGIVNDYINQNSESKKLKININSISSYSGVMVANDNNSVNTNALGSFEDVETDISVEVGNKKLSNNDVIHEKEYLKYSVKLKNNSDNLIDNIVIKGAVPEGTVYINYYNVESTIEDVVQSKYDLFREEDDKAKTEYNEKISLKAKEEKEICYYVKVDEIENGEEGKVNGKIQIYFNDEEKVNYTLTNVVKKADLDVKVTAWITQRIDDVWLYKIIANNNTEKTINNAIVNLFLPDELTYKYTDEEGLAVETQGNTVQVKLDSLESGSREIILFLKPISLSDDISEYFTTVVASVTGDGVDTYYSGINRQKMYSITMEIIQSSDKEGKELAYDEEIEYKFIIKNTSSVNSERAALNFRLYDYISEDMDPQTVEYETYDMNEVDGFIEYTKVTKTDDLTIKDYVEGVEDKDIADVNIFVLIPSNKEIEIKVKVKAGIVSEKTEVTNQGIVKYEYNGEHTKTSNIIKNTILPYNDENEDDTKDDDSSDVDEPDDGEDSDDGDDSEQPGNSDDTDDADDTDDSEQPDEENKLYSISGLAWLDINKDGERTSNEQKISGITVKLFNAKTNAIEVDENNNIRKTTTSSDGSYEFANIKVGEYLVLFEYDTNVYTLTTYQKSGISSELNSDAILKEVKIDENTLKAGVTDIIKVKNQNIENIDIGLIENDKFDLSLNKSITKVTLKYDNKEKEYDYKESKLAKVEVPAKKISGASITVEYQFEIKNEGNVDGYVNEIIDYLPDGFEFDSEKNEGWSQSGNGILKNTGLTGSIIKSGESKIIKLYLTRELNNNSIGTLTNSTEISKSASINGSSDIDSVNGNKNSEEDDFSKAELIISVKTGMLLYTNIFIGSILILIVLKFLIDKKIIKIKMFIKLTSVGMFVLVIGMGMFSNAGAPTEDEYRTSLNRHIDTSVTINCFFSNSNWDSQYTCYYEYTGKSGLVNHTYNYYHHEVYSIWTVPLDKLFCSDGGDMCTNPPGWEYHPSYIEYLCANTPTKTTTGTKPTITKTAKAVKVSSEGKLKGYMGPYKVSYTGTLDWIKAYVEKTDGTKEWRIITDRKGKDGNAIENINGKEFYIKVDDDIKEVKKVRVQVKNTMTTVYNTTIVARETWQTDEGSGNPQILAKRRNVPYSKTDTNYKTAKVDLKGGKISAELTIEKVDEDTDDEIEGAKFKLEKKNDDNKWTSIQTGLTTNDKGKIEVEDLDPGEYRITETAAATGYNLNLQDNNEKTKEVTLNTGDDKTVEVKNRKYGDLRILKVDKDTGNTLNQIGFKIYVNDGTTKKYIGSYTQGNPSTLTYDNNTTNKVFYTGDSNYDWDAGEILLVNIPLDTYYIEEYSIPDDLSKDYDKISAPSSEKLITNANDNMDYMKRVTKSLYTRSDALKATKSLTNVQLVKNMYSGITGKKEKDLTDANAETLISKAGGLEKSKGLYKKNQIKKVIDQIFKYDKLFETDYIAKSVKKVFENDTNKENYINNIVNEKLNLNLNKNSMKFKQYYYRLCKNTVSLIENKRNYGDLVITKTDADTGNKLSGVKFYIYVKDGSKEKYISSYTKGTPSTITYGTAKTFETGDSNYNWDAGEIELVNLPMNTYYIKEAELSNDMEGYYKLDQTEHKVDLKNNLVSTTNISITNKQIYTDVTGYVWEDKANANKKVDYDNVYTSNGVDLKVQGITVRIKDQSGTVKHTATTGSDGSYKFTKVEIAQLTNYHIEFEYNGLKYTNVAKTNNNNGSKAEEAAATRTNFNNSYSQIVGGNAKNTGTIGYSKNTSGTTTNTLTYKNGTYTSSLVQNTGYTVASASGSVTAQNGSAGVKMTANTGTLSWTKGSKEISNMNLGLKERAQPDMSIATDLDTIDLTLNGYSHTYKYNKRMSNNSINIFSEAQKWNKTEAQKLQEEATYPRSYTRSIYKNYVYATGVTGDGNLDDKDKLKVYLTYKIQVRNESTLYMSANEIINYLDTSLDIVESWYTNSSGKKVDITWKSYGVSNGYNKYTTTSVNGNKIGPSTSLTIYVKTKKKDETILEWAKKDTLNENTYNTYNTTEIGSYSTYTKHDTKEEYYYYAGIDKDSAPNNISLGTVNTYEDDTDSAPVVTFTFDEARTISGYVFEDSADFGKNEDETELHTGKERLGDGKYNASDDRYVGNVKVELINVSNNEQAYIYPKTVSDSNQNGQKAIYTTTKEGKGYYEFAGVIPGQYYLKFTYGDGSIIYKTIDGQEKEIKVTTQDYKSTIVKSDAVKTAFGENDYKVDGDLQWYQDSNVKGYSAALDDWTTRKNINNKLSTITYGTKTGYESKTTDYAGVQKIYARTPNMEIAIENSKNEETTENLNRTRVYDNINFGIAERPRQSIETTKEISHIKLILANGQVLVEGDPRTDTIRYVTYPKAGSLKIEVDNEIIEGATLEVTYEIKITNNSELDYDIEKYYRYGDNTGVTAVGMTINSVIDYMDEDLKTTYTYDSNTGWKIVKAEEVYSKGLILQDVYNSVKNRYNILVNECTLTIAPGSSESVYVSASKLLSTSNEMIYKNYVEVLKASNSVGRFYGQTDSTRSTKWKLITPGNFNLSNLETSELDNNSTRRAELSIIPPTGENKNIIIYITVGMACLAILTVGIVLIKKKVLE